MKQTEKWVGELEESTLENIQSEQPRNNKLKMQTQEPVDNKYTYKHMQLDNR